MCYQACTTYFAGDYNVDLRFSAHDSYIGYININIILLKILL